MRPDILLGLTATPERTDGKSLLPDFDGHVAAELRIWHALDRQLLVPFEYYGISDATDLSRVRWNRTGYDASDLAGIYTGNEARVDLVVRQLERRVADVRQLRALAFCVSIEHAEFMAKALTARGLPALAVHGKMADADRVDAPRRLRELSVNVLCTCDLYNEGVDLPFVDTLLLLRPTASATLFLQQLGRGLRLSPGKPTCLVLDFIGRHRAEFRFDATLSALTGIPRTRLTRAVEESFPLLPKLPGKREILLVTLDKSSKSFSPTTRYRDYAISPTLFHWETQSVASVSRESGRRYIESPRNGWSFYLFVRMEKDAPYAFVGPVTYVSHEGDRPIAMTWEIQTPLPAGLYGSFATLAQG